jgi:hypothetical protein
MRTNHMSLSRTIAKGVLWNPATQTRGRVSFFSHGTIRHMQNAPKRSQGTAPTMAQMRKPFEKRNANTLYE